MPASERNTVLNRECVAMSQQTVESLRSPFQVQPDAEWFYESVIHEEALARLLFAVEERRRLAMLTGPAGTGKTLLLHVLRRHCLRQGCDVVLCDATSLDAQELLWHLAAELGLAPTARASRFELWRRLEDSLSSRNLGRQQTVLLLDHFDRAHSGAADVLWRLLCQPASPWNALTCVAATRGSAVQSVGEALSDRADVTARLQKLDRRHTVDYVRQSMIQAGCRADWFDQGAVERIFEQTQGVLRAINRVCELSFLAASETRSESIDADFVDAAFHELQQAS